MTTFKPITEAEPLDQFVTAQPLQPFLQTWAWGEFQQAVGRRIWRLGAWRDERLIGSALVVEHQLMMGKTYLYCPRGPLADDREILIQLLSAIRKLGQAEGAMYVKVDLGLNKFPLPIQELESAWSPGTPLQPATTLVLDLKSDSDTMLNAMHQKTRYNIRLAEKKGVTTRASTAAKDFQTFLDLMHQTAKRQEIRLHPDSYYQKLFTTLISAKMAELMVAEYQRQTLASHLMIWCGQTATYLHGASADDNKNIMAPHLLQWRTIELAKRRGMEKYDWWGIHPDDPNHRWAGITRFKLGFGGEIVKYPGAINAVLQPQWYMAYRLAKRMRGGFDV